MTDVEDLRRRLARAESYLAMAEAAKVKADRLSETAHELGGGIPGFGGAGNQSAAGKVRAAHERAHAIHRDADERIEKWGHRVIRLRLRIADAERVPLTATDLKGATLVRSKHGWHKVVRVNGKTVTIPSLVGGSWTDRIDIAAVLEARFPE